MSGFFYPSGAPANPSEVGVHFSTRTEIIRVHTDITHMHADTHAHTYTLQHAHHTQTHTVRVLPSVLNVKVIKIQTSVGT